MRQERAGADRALATLGDARYVALVGDLHRMLADPPMLDGDASAQEAGEALSRPEVRAVFVSDEGGRLLGVVTRKTLVREVVADLGVPIVHVTHSVGEARALADQIVRLEKGKVVARGKPADVLEGVTSLEE